MTHKDTGRNYPTRMHELCQMEPCELAWLDTKIGKLPFVVDYDGYAIDMDANVLSSEIICNMINHPERIIRRPRLTKDQVYALEAIFKIFGMKWLVKTKYDSIYACQNKPIKTQSEWHDKSGISLWLVNLKVDLSSLVSWEDPEPLNIVQTLRDAGVDVGVAAHD